MCRWPEGGWGEVTNRYTYGKEKKRQRVGIIVSIYRERVQRE